MVHAAYSWTYSWTPVNDLAVSSASPNAPYAALGVGGYVLRFFTYWDLFPIANTQAIRNLAVHPWDANDLLAGATTKVYRSQDGGLTWHQVFSDSYLSVDIAIDSNQPQNRYLLTRGSNYSDIKIQRSTDSGETWADWTKDTIIQDLGERSSLLVDDSGGVYLFTSSAIYYSSGEDADWQIVTQDFQGIFGGALWHGKSSFLLRTGIRGLWRKNLPPIHKIWFPAISN